MNYSVIPIPKFKKEAKRLIKKYPSLKLELLKLNSQLALNPKAGTSLGFDTYKIRLAIQSKSGGARVITYNVTENKEVYLLTIYDKSEFDNVDIKLLKQIISSIKEDEI